MLRRIILVILITSSLASAADTDPFVTVSEYEEIKNSEMVRSYLFAAGQAYVYFNITLTRHEKEPLFCPPSGQPLSSADYVAMFEKALPKARRIFGASVGNVTLEVILLDGLRAAFPC